MNVPCAKSNGLPVGMMLIGRHFEDDVVLRAAHAFEKLGIYTNLGPILKHSSSCMEDT